MDKQTLSSLSVKDLEHYKETLLKRIQGPFLSYFRPQKLQRLTGQRKCGIGCQIELSQSSSTQEKCQRQVNPQAYIEILTLMIYIR